MQQNRRLECSKLLQILAMPKPREKVIVITVIRWKILFIYTETDDNVKVHVHETAIYVVYEKYFSNHYAVALWRLIFSQNPDSFEKLYPTVLTVRPPMSKFNQAG